MEVQSRLPLLLGLRQPRQGHDRRFARRSIDWLHDTGCRVLALMGGEVLLRPQFAHKVVDYAAQKGFWVYVPTNGRLMRPEVIDRLGDAGVATFNLAVDSVADRKELPKALDPIRSYFDYLIKKQYVYGFSVFFNINITRINLEDVRQLTEIAHDVGIATDYHINESPMLEQPHFKHKDGNSTFIAPRGLAAGRCHDRLAHREEPVGLQDGELRAPPAGNEGVHARQAAGVGLPGRAELADYSDGRHAGALLPDV